MLVALKNQSYTDVTLVHPDIANMLIAHVPHMCR